MIDQSSLSRFSTGVPVMAIRRSAGIDRTLWVGAGCAVLDLLCLVENHAAPRTLASNSTSRVARP